MNRRLALKSLSAVMAAAAAPLTWVANAQQLFPVRLMVVRRLGLSPTNECLAPCIRGQLYDVSHLRTNTLDQTLIPALRLLTPVCDVIERPWKDNKPNVSSIPKGVYPATIRKDKTKGWMDTENKTWRLELKRTGGRSAIQFHFGKDESWSQGCFIVGTLLQPGDAAGITARYCTVTDGELAIAALRRVVEATGRNTADIRIGVADDATLFAGNVPPPRC